MLIHYLEDMRAAVLAGRYYSALALAMAIPDICGSIDQPRADVGPEISRLVRSMVYGADRKLDRGR
jgi:hypothetical protein